MRPIVENMGLDWGGQAVKLKANRGRWTVEMISTVAQDGVKREMLSMPVRKLPAWLNSINPKKVRPELRAKIELYQAESDDALWNYWINGRAERAKAEPVIPSPISKRTDPERKALTASEGVLKHREKRTAQKLEEVKVRRGYDFKKNSLPLQQAT